MICWSGDPSKHAQYVAEAVEVLTPHKDEFDGIISAGLSGLLVAAPVSIALEKTLGIVRRKGDGKHEGQHTNLGTITRALFIDDHFGSGNTFRACRDALKRNSEYPGEAEVARYEELHGTQWCRRNFPEWYVSSPGYKVIVAVYCYNKSYSARRYAAQYVLPDSEEGSYIQNCYGLWTTEEYKALTKKSPKKKAERPLRAKNGRFARKVVTA